MAKIKIKDLPNDMTITEKELGQIMGGFNPQPEPPAYINPRLRPKRPYDKRFNLVRTSLIQPLNIRFMSPGDD